MIISSRSEFWRDHWKPLALGALAILFLLGLRPALTLRSSWPKLHGVVNTSTLQWEEVSCYFPFANRVSVSNPFPARPYADPSFKKFTNFPHLTLWVQALVYKLFCFGSPTAFFLTMHLLFPLLTFFLLYLAYLRFLTHRKWILFFSFAGVMSFNNFSYLEWLGAFLRTPGWDTLVSAASLTPPEMTRMPSPSFTFFFFMLCFYLTVKERKPSVGRSVTLSVLWGLNLYVYLFNFITGGLFWMFYLVYAQWLADRGIKPLSILKRLLPHAAILGLMALPVVFNVLQGDEVSRQIMEKMGLATRLSGVLIDPKTLVLYFVLPLAAAFLVVKVFAFDVYELFYRFAPVIIVLFLELLIMNLHMIFGKFLQPHLFSIRIASFFFHFLYLTPVIFYVNNPPKTFFHGGWDSERLARLSRGLRRWVIERAGVYLVPAALLISVHAVASSVKDWRNHAFTVAPEMIVLDQRLAELASVAKPGEVVVSDALPLNLMVPALTPQATLWENVFNNHERTENILERFALYAKIYGWDKGRFLEFMSPAEWNLMIYEDPDFRFTQDVYRKGMGYWLSFHHQKMDDADLAAYRTRLEDLYSGLDVAAAMKKFSVKWIQTDGPAPSVPARLVPGERQFPLYEAETGV